jgi:hypothetical protein
MGTKLLSIGFGNTVVVNRVVAILAPNSSPMKRLRGEAQKKGCLVDASFGRKTRSIIVTDSNHVILSSLNAETVAQRLATIYDEK